MEYSNHMLKSHKGRKMRKRHIMFLGHIKRDTIIIKTILEEKVEEWSAGCMQRYMSTSSRDGQTLVYYSEQRGQVMDEQ